MLPTGEERREGSGSGGGGGGDDDDPTYVFRRMEVVFCFGGLHADGGREVLRRRHTRVALRRHRDQIDAVILTAGGALRALASDCF